ncbi:hypothetical protein [Streptomyces sp. MS06]|uniref:hypothetical protein n=1 Tax=Streptomyces sp. MS06 TaxID=3385974 RepID=UPI0039A28DEB
MAPNPVSWFGLTGSALFTARYPRSVLGWSALEAAGVVPAGCSPPDREREHAIL